MNNEEKAREIMQTFTDVYGINIERDSHIYSACMQMAQWKDEQIKQLIHYADAMETAMMNLKDDTRPIRKAIEEYRNYKFKEIY